MVAPEQLHHGKGQPVTTGFIFGSVATVRLPDLRAKIVILGVNKSIRFLLGEVDAIYSELACCGIHILF